MQRKRANKREGAKYKFAILRLLSLYEAFYVFVFLCALLDMTTWHKPGRCSTTGTTANNHKHRTHTPKHCVWHHKSDRTERTRTTHMIKNATILFIQWEVTSAQALGWSTDKRADQFMVCCSKLSSLGFCCCRLRRAVCSPHGFLQTNRKLAAE